MATYDLDELVPEDLEITYRGAVYTLPGDLASEDAFRLVRYRNLIGESDTVAAQEKNVQQIMSFLLDMLRQRSPDLDACPFGVFGSMKVVARYLEHIGLEVSDAEQGEDVVADPDDEVPPNRAARRASSTGSPASPKSSGGSRKRGGASPSAT